MSDESPPPKKRRRRLWWLLLIPALLAAIVFALFRDEALKPADDLLPQRTEVAWDENNGWKRLYDFAKKITPLDKVQSPKLSRVISLMEDPGPGEWKALALSDAELTEMESIAAMPVFQDVLYESSAAVDEAEPTQILRPLRRLQATAVSAMEEGQVPLVLRCLRLADRLGRKQMAGASSETGFFCGRSWLNDEVAARMLVRMELSDAELKELAAIAGTDKIIPEDVRAMMRHEFRIGCDRIQKVTDFTELPISGKRRFKELYLQRNRTANLLAERYRETMPLVLAAPWMDFRKLNLKEKDLDGWASWLEPNSSGIAWVQYGIDPADREVSWRHHNAIRRCLQVIVALHRFQKTRGNLPAALSELVPDFLVAVPIGPFHFEPLRWDAKFRTVRFLDADGHLGDTKGDPHELIRERGAGATVFFRTKAEEDARRAAIPPPRPKVGPRPAQKPAAPAPPVPSAGGANK